MQVRDITNPFQLKSLLDWIVRQLANNTGAVTLATGTTTTTVQHGKCVPNSVITLTAQTANAAATQNTIWVTPGNGSFVITHANLATTNRTFGYSIFGV